MKEVYKVHHSIIFNGVHTWNIDSPFEDEVVIMKPFINLPEHYTCYSFREACEYIDTYNPKRVNYGLGTIICVDTEGNTHTIYDNEVITITFKTTYEPYTGTIYELGQLISANDFCEYLKEHLFGEQ